MVRYCNVEQCLSGRCKKWEKTEKISFFAVPKVMFHIIFIDIWRKSVIIRVSYSSGVDLNSILGFHNILFFKNVLGRVFPSQVLSLLNQIMHVFCKITPKNMGQSCIRIIHCPIFLHRMIRGERLGVWVCVKMWNKGNKCVKNIFEKRTFLGFMIWMGCQIKFQE